MAAAPEEARSARAEEIIHLARQLLEREGRDALTMRRLAGELGIRAPSLYKHLPGKQAIELALIEAGLAEMGAALHASVQPGSDREGAARDLLAAYRRISLAQPNLYRLATGGPLPREQLQPGLEEWAGEPFFLVTGDVDLARALWSFAHGMVILEIDARYPEGSDLDGAWEAGARAFGNAGARPGSQDRPAGTGD